MRSERFSAATIGAPFGVKGFVKLISHSGEYEHLAALDSYTVLRDGREQYLAVEEARDHGGAIIVKFVGIDSPEDAALLKGLQVLVDREHAAPLSDEEYYIEDLKGLSLVFGGEPLARVSDVVEGGGAELMEVVMNDGSGTRFIPFRKEFIGEIDPDAGTVVLLARWILE